MTARRWCFTSYDLLVQDTLRAYFDDEEAEDKVLRGCAFQLELCPDTDRRHVQGYAEFYAPARFKSLQRITGDPAMHCERARGTREQNLTYVSKEGTSVGGTATKLGTWPEPAQGARTDLSSIALLIRDGSITWATKQSHLWDDHYGAMVKYSRGLGLAYQYYRSREAAREPPEVIVHWGASGTGKTRAVYDLIGPDRLPAHELFRVPASSDGRATWFDGYIGQSVVLFDDFDGRTPPIAMMLQILDRYPVTLPVKCSFTAWNPAKIYITSNLNPETEWYTEAHPDQRAGILRRLTTVKHFVGALDPHIHLAPEDDYEE